MKYKLSSNGKSRGIKQKLGAFGRILSKHKYITVICTVLLFAGAFAIISQNNSRPSDAAAGDPVLRVNKLNTDNLTVASYLTPSSTDISAFNAIQWNNPIVITTQSQLLGFANAVNTGLRDFSGYNVQLGANIDLGGGTVSYSAVANADGETEDYVVTGNPGNVWIPIGNEQYKFRGNFNGNGYTISNMTSIVQKFDGVQSGSITFNSVTAAKVLLFISFNALFL